MTRGKLDNQGQSCYHINAREQIIRNNKRRWHGQCDWERETAICKFLRAPPYPVKVCHGERRNLQEAVFILSTSKLQKYTGKELRRRFAKYGIVENTRPDWLISSKGERLELDFHLERLGIAIEVQGGQHFEFTPVFHASEWDFQEQVRRDREKLEICQRAGVELLYVCKKGDVGVVLAVCYDALKPQENNQKSIWIRTPQQENGIDRYILAQKNILRGTHTLKLYAQMIQDGKKLKKKSCENGALRIRQIRRAVKSLGLLLGPADRRNIEIVESYLSH